MDINKIKEDFQKRYEQPPENIFFCGKPIIFIRRPGLTLGTSLSIGGYIAVAKRDDDRIQLQYSDSNRLFCTNVSELKIRKGNKICDMLMSLEEYGVVIGGADILIHENTRLNFPIEPLLLCAQESFCKNALPPYEAIKHFEHYEENRICVTSKSNRITAICGKETEYLPFHNQRYKIVLSKIEERIPRREYASASADDAQQALSAQDMERFGHIINKSTEIFLRGCRNSKSSRLFEAAARLGDSLGNGMLPFGGIFSIVENSRIDTFVHNLGGFYEKYYGGRPEFYITRAEDSAIRLTLP